MRSATGPLDRPLAFLLGCQALLFSAALISGAGAREDFGSLYAAGVAVLSGERHRLYETTDGFVLAGDRLLAMRERGYPGTYALRFFYHPFLALLAAPLAMLPYPVAASAFVGAGVVVLGCWLALSVVRGHLPVLAAAGLGLAVVLFYPYRMAIDYGQASVFMLPLLGLVALAPAAAGSGLALGLLLLARPLLWPVLVLLLADRRLRPAGIACGAVVVCATLVAAQVLGTGSVARFADVVVERSRQLVVYAGAQSLLHQVFRLLVGTSLAGEIEGVLRPVPGAVKAVFALLSVAILACTWWCVRRIRDPGGRVAVAALGSLLAAPFAWTHYFPVLFLPAVWALQGGRRAAGVAAVVGLLACNLPLRYEGWLLRLLSFNCYAGALIVGAAVVLSLPPRGEDPGRGAPGG